MYTDHVIYSPKVPWFRTQSRNLLEDVFFASVITAPAPNAGQILRRDLQGGARDRNSPETKSRYCAGHC
ncbi:MAG: TIGR02452 family protein, partial [Cyanobacteria bacterium P01_G01_bin.38]